LAGDGVEMDKKKAFELFSSAAEGGFADAQYNLGTACCALARARLFLPSEH
jgi:TPR repeat protein